MQLKDRKSDNSSPLVFLNPVKSAPVLDIVFEIVCDQTAEGFWLPSALGKINFGQTNSSVRDEIWATVVILAWLREKQSDREAEWSLLAIKAKKWLKSQGVDPLSFQIEFNP